MKNSKDDDYSGVDALYEALSIDKVYVRPTLPPEFVRGKLYQRWWGYNPDNKLDEVYLNKEGKKHRVYGPAYISHRYNYEEWCINGEYHRVGGPALKHKDSEFWLQHGKLHRLDGPAVITPSGPKQYWINGQKLSPKEYKKEIERRKRKGLL